MNTIVQRLDGTTYDLAQMDIVTRDFNVSSLSPIHTTETVEGRHGAINTRTVYDVRKISCSFYLKAVDMDDYVLLRDEVFRIFKSDEAFYLIDDRQPWKRWLVKSNSAFEIEQTSIYGMFEIEFIAFQPFAESIGTTQDSFMFDSELFGLGMGFSVEELQLQYTHSATSFRIYNAGDETIDPRSLPLVIRFSGESNGLTIQNATTGDTWTYRGVSNAGDLITLDGVRSLKNGTSIFGDTNYNLITLAPGWNDFVISKAAATFSISFNFRFYYH